MSFHSSSEEMAIGAGPRYAPLRMVSSPSNTLAIDVLVRDACRGSTEPLRDLLLRRGGVPGPRPNFKLASNVAQALFAQGTKGHELLDEMLGMDVNAAPAGSSFPILPMVGVIGLGVAAASAEEDGDIAKALGRLYDHAEDPRWEVRDAVGQALGMALSRHPSRALEALRVWSDGYFQAELMLRAASEPVFVQKLDDVRLILARLQEAFALAAGAPRAHQRSQGYRALLRALSIAIASFGSRFPQPLALWIEEHAQVATTDLLVVLNESLDKLRGGGLRRGDAQTVHEALEAAIPPPRDPRWDVGPTRGRGKKARKRGRRG